MATAADLPNPYELGGCVYYAQNREDLILQSFFPDVKRGFYVDVGAFDPNYDSVTKLFYLQGWRGINIEPQTDRWKLFQSSRKRDINVNVGIASKEGTLTLRTYTSGGLATFSESVKHDYEQTPDEDTQEYTESTVAVLPLRKVLDQHNIQHIDFMKVDVEGLEYEALASNDWKRFRPEVLCVEANHIEQDWRPIIRQAGYVRVFDDGLNEYYADKHTGRAHKFHFVKDIINDRGGGLRFDHFERMATLYEYARQKDHHIKELMQENERLESIIAKAQQQIEAYEIDHASIRATTKHLLRLLKRNLKKE